MGYHSHVDFSNLICTKINTAIFTGIIFKDIHNDFLNATLHHIINISVVSNCANWKNLMQCLKHVSKMCCTFLLDNNNYLLSSCLKCFSYYIVNEE